MIKINFRLQNYEEMMTRYKQLLTYIKSAVTRNYSEKVINKILDLVSGSEQMALLQELYTLDGTGTLISRDLYDGIRVAVPEDTPGMIELIAPLEAEGILVTRPRAELARDVHAGFYYVFTRDVGFHWKQYLVATPEDVAGELNWAQNRPSAKARRRDMQDSMEPLFYNCNFQGATGSRICDARGWMRTKRAKTMASCSLTRVSPARRVAAVPQRIDLHEARGAVGREQAEPERAHRRGQRQRRRGDEVLGLD